MIKFCVLGSGSKGNSIFVDVDGKQMLVDCGFTKKEISKRLRYIGKSFKDIGEIYITHSHLDHLNLLAVSGKNVIGIYADELRFNTISNEKGPVEEEINFGIIRFPVSHDVECYGYSIKDKWGNKLVIVPDTGCVTESMLRHMLDANAIIIETNYDVSKLANNQIYPSELISRVSWETGHLRNECASEAINTVAWPGLKFVVGWHLSEQNNEPDFARHALETAVGWNAQGCEVVIAEQNEPTKLMTLI